ncbi:MAG: hypothetical protein MZU91_14105 [Desulfosudis oleivorans]|nr:hypothetical protein [Desulfosudis oleivorans]
MPIKEIVALHGWDFFRAKERETIEYLTQKEDGVIATGGGVVLFRENVKLLKQNVDLLKQTGVVIWLNAPLQDIIDRLKKDAQNEAITSSIYCREYCSGNDRYYEKETSFI